MEANKEALNEQVTKYIEETTTLDGASKKAMAAICNQFAVQIISDLTSIKAKTLLNGTDLVQALKSRGLYHLAEEVQAHHLDLLNISKHQAMLKLRAAGYGSTSEHVSFMRKVFAAPHDKFVSTDAAGDDLK